MQKEEDFVIRINPEYEALIDPLTPSEYESLKESIRNNGQLDRAVVNSLGEILDGHTRYRACSEVGRPFLYDVRPYKSRLDDKLYIWEKTKKRDWTKFQRAKNALRLESSFVERARQNMSNGGKDKGSKYLESFHVDKELAKESGTTTNFIYTVRQILKFAKESPDKRPESNPRNTGTYSSMIKDIEAEKLKPYKAYSIMKRSEEILSKRAQAHALAESLKLPSKVKLIHADSTKMEELKEIPDGSVDLILTDLPYGNDSLPLSEALAKIASQKLRDGGSVVFLFGEQLIFKIGEQFAASSPELKFRGFFKVKHEGHGTRIHDREVWSEIKLALWYVKGDDKLLPTDVHDFIDSTKPDKSVHPWAQSEVEATEIIKMLTISEDSLVVDPFLGSGAFALGAIRLRRYFIGVEKDKQVLENATNNIKIQTASELPQGKTPQNSKVGIVATLGQAIKLVGTNNTKFVPLSREQANEFIRTYHRHNDKVVRDKFRIGLLYNDSELIGVAVAAKPIAYHLDDGNTIEIVRVCVRDGFANACSMLYSNMTKIAKLLGYEKVITYTLSRESQSSMRAIGAVSEGVTKPCIWNTNKRARKPKNVYSEEKIRWRLS